MQTEIITIANLKCSGCAHTIKTKLESITGVYQVAVNVEEDNVTVNFEEPATRLAITEKLHDLGYPEATAENGLLLQMKSYASCMLGKVSQ